MHKESITHLHCLRALCLAGVIRKLGGRCVEVSMDESHKSRASLSSAAAGYLVSHRRPYYMLKITTCDMRVKSVISAFMKLNLNFDGELISSLQNTIL